MAPFASFLSRNSYRSSVFLAALFCSALTGAARERLRFDDGWRFHLGDVPNAQTPGFDVSSWKTLDLPHDWIIEGEFDSAAPTTGQGGFLSTGIGWYQRAFNAPKTWTGQRVTLEFDGVYMNSEVWLNGEQLGNHTYGYTPFRFDLTSHLKWGVQNMVVIRVDNSQQPNTRWYSGSGIYRHVWLNVVSPVHLAPEGIFATFSAVSPAFAKAHFETTVHNDSSVAQTITLETTVFDSARHSVASTRTEGSVAPNANFIGAPELTLPKPKLWSPEAPTLYHVLTRVLVQNKVVDQIETPIGLRTVKVSAERGFELNGQVVKLVGGNVHHDNGVLGAAAFDRAEERRVELLKAAGFNAIRTSHNPPSPAFLDACDRLGLLVMDESFDCWEKGKNKFDYSAVFKDQWKNDVDAMVLRDRNHPSVVMWSIGNEVYERGNASGARIAKELTDRIREFDPTRPITAGINGMGKNGDWTKTDPVFATLDIAGYNYEIDRHAEDHVRLPSRVIVGTESEQNKAFLYWSTTHDFPYMIGEFVWSALDYLGEAGIGRPYPPDQVAAKHWEVDEYPWHGAYCGDVDLTGWRKPISHYRNILWERGEKLYAVVIAPTPDGRPWNLSQWAMPPALPSWTWPGQEGKELAVEVYSRYASVRLYLDKKLVGEKPTTRSEEFKATFSVPFVPGTLRAVGVTQGREVETFTLNTARAAARIRLSADRARIKADGQDLVFVTVEIVDQNGVVQPQADHAIKFQIEGPASLAGVGNRDMTTGESYRANPHRVYQGRELLVLRSTHERGKIKVTATAPGLASTTIKLSSTAQP